jgi:hypothetical protein
MRGKFFAALVIGVLLCSISFGATYGGGAGTAASPYQIWTAEQMGTIGNNSADWGKYFILMADLDLQGFTLTPIGNSTTRFTGSFNGNGHVIRDATINMPSSSGVGVFGSVGTEGKVFNLGVESAAITGQSSVGILAGANSGTLSNCYTTGTVTGSSFNIGGLVGSNAGTVSNCYAIATVTGGTSSSNIGGLIGNVSGGTVINCYAAGTSTGDGLIGYLTSGTVTGCFWDVQTYGLTGIAGGTGKTTAQMQDVNTYLLAKWDFDFETFNGTQNIWTISPGQYPRFVWQPGDPVDIVSVPGVTLLTKTAAECAIVAARLTVWVTNVYSDTVAAGTVISQSPAVDTPLIAGMPVNISVSLGPKITGSGTETDPSRIGTIADWQAFMNGSMSRTNCILIADLDLRFVTLKPIDNFTGFLNGSGHVIRNATITTAAAYVGLFGYIDTSARISYLGLESVTASSDYDYTGGLAGINYGTIHNCYAAGTITGNGLFTGGLVGANYGILDQCYADGTVTADSITSNTHVGGLAGYNRGSVNRCYAMGSVICNRSGSPYYAGGLIGRNYQKSIHQCYATGAVIGNVIGNPSYIGGLIGYNENGGAYQCYATGSVSGRIFSGGGAYVGGLVGYGGSIDNCYATGRVSGPGSATVGGLAGCNVAISTSYSTGVVINSSMGGGLVGVSGSTPIYDSFWDMQTSGRSSSGGGTGKTTEQMQTRSTFADAGWDFADETANGTEDIWMISSGQYPRMVWQDSAAGAAVTVPNVTSLAQGVAENTITAAGFTVWVTNVYSNTAASGTVIKQSPAAGTTLQQGWSVNITVSLGLNYPSGSGTEADPYKIGTVQDWQWRMHNTAEWGKYYILIADLDLRYVVLTPVGNSTTKFTGSFNGNGHVIRNATINTSGSSVVGLFGYIDTAGRVFDLNLESVTMNGMSGVGGLAGVNDGTVNGCHVTGDIAGNDHVGGLLGHNNGAVGHCSAKGSVSNSSGPYTGGLIGYINKGTISDCDAASTVRGYTYAGGLAGYKAAGKIKNCYSIGVVKAFLMGGQYFGGLLGYDVSGSVEQCYSTGSVCLRPMQGASQYVGGLTGRNESGTIKNCYSTGSVGGLSSLGGFIGGNQGTISQCYSAGYVQGSGGGGFCGPNSGTLTACFWDTQTSGKTLSGGGSGVQGKTTAQMKTFSTFESPGWTAGRMGNALSFDGVDDYIVVQGHNGISGSHARTVSVWFKTSTPVWQTGGTMPSTMSLVQWGRDDYFNGLWMVGLSPDRKAFIRVNSGSGVRYGTNALNDGQWHNIIAILREGEGTPSLYVDGTFNSGGGSIFPPLYTSTRTENMPVHIGSQGHYNNGTLVVDSYAQGLIDDVRIYNRSLNTAEIVPDNLPLNGLVARWSMDETEGAVAHDSVSSYNGELKNIGWDFVGETANGTEDIWFIREGQEYPRLMWEIENGQSGLFHEGFVTINKTRVGRTSFEYELAVRVRNSNAFAMNNVQMKLMDWDAAVQSVSDDSITIDTIPAGATVTSTDTFKIVVDRSTLINSSRLVWELTYYTAASGDQVQQAMMSMLLSEIDAGVSGDISGDGKVNFDDFAILAQQWDAAPGSPSADIDPSQDGHVWIEDLMYLAENWMK